MDTIAERVLELRTESGSFEVSVLVGRPEPDPRGDWMCPELGMVFPCLVRLSRSHVEVRGKRVPLAPGFAATAEIKTGDRRVLEFLLSPLARRVQEAGRER